MLLSIGDRVSPGTYEVHSRFSRVINFHDGTSIVAVVDKSVDPGPRRIVVKGESLDRVESLRVEPDRVLLDGRKMSLSDVLRYDSAITWSEGPTRILEAHLEVLQEVLVEQAPSRSMAFVLAAERLRQQRPGFEANVVQDLRRAVAVVLPVLGGLKVGMERDDMARLLQGVGMLSGCGFGLTPSGDDYICGMMIGIHVLEKMWGRSLEDERELVFLAATSDNDLSTQYLTLARDGRVFAGMKHLLASLGGDGVGVRGWAEHVLGIGETSGGDLLVGLLLTLKHASLLNETEGDPE